MIREFPEIKAGWWATHVPPDATATEVVEIVEREHPAHPALPRLRKAAAGYERAKSREHTYRCYLCRDSCWVEGHITTERGIEVEGVSRCRGPAGAGCLADKWRQSRVKKPDGGVNL